LSSFRLDARMMTPTRSTQTPSRLATAWRYWLRPFVLVALTLFAFRSAVLDWNVVPTGSMRPTIVEGDYILVNKLAYDVRVPFAGWRLLPSGEPGRGDIVIFEPPGETDRYVKRVIGLPGDVVELHGNRLHINGEPAGYAMPGTEMLNDHTHEVLLPSNWSPGGDLAPVVVPKGHYFVLGDNRGNSKDSRVFGFVARDRILGKATRVVVSLDPLHRWRPRLSRLFQPLA
jgi:signal peptidase I